jgi:hypothetical protein
VIPDPLVKRSLWRRRMGTLAVLLTASLVLVVIELFWPYLFAGTALWTALPAGGAPGGGEVRVYPLQEDSGPQSGTIPEQGLTVFWRPAGAWRWTRLTARVPSDAFAIRYQLEPGFLHISYQEPDHRLGDTMVVLPRR